MEKKQNKELQEVVKGLEVIKKYYYRKLKFGENRGARYIVATKEFLYITNTHSIISVKNVFNIKLIDDESSGLSIEQIQELIENPKKVIDNIDASLKRLSIDYVIKRHDKEVPLTIYKDNMKLVEDYKYKNILVYETKTNNEDNKSFYLLKEIETFVKDYSKSKITFLYREGYKGIFKIENNGITIFSVPAGEDKLIDYVKKDKKVYTEEQEEKRKSLKFLKTFVSKKFTMSSREKTILVEKDVVYSTNLQAMVVIKNKVNIDLKGNDRIYLERKQLDRLIEAPEGVIDDTDKQSFTNGNTPASIIIDKDYSIPLKFEDAVIKSYKYNNNDSYDVYVIDNKDNQPPYVLTKEYVDFTIKNLKNSTITASKNDNIIKIENEYGVFYFCKIEYDSARVFDKN